MSAPRVLLINYEFPPIGGGAGTGTAGMARALADMGCDTVVLTSRFRDQPGIEEMQGFVVRRVRVLRKHADRCSPIEMLTFIASAALAVIGVTRTWRPDLTIAFFGIPSGPVAWVVRALRGTPYIVSLRGGDVPGFDCAPGISRYHRAATPVLRFLWQRAVAVVANGTGLRDLAQQTMPSLRVPIIPNGVDAERHAPAPRRSVAATPRVLFLGRLAYQKAPDVLLRALARITDKDFTCEIVGDGPDRAALEQLARELGLFDRIVFRGWVAREDLPACYHAADIVALPSRMEGMPNVVLEAMAHALPVVATDVPGTRDIVRADETGFLVPAEDDAALAAAIARLIEQPALRSAMGDAARARILAEHTWPQAAAAYLRLADLQPPTAPAAGARSAAGAA
jgi:glycosyltransferase involved in cell wall biosynthesis